VCDLATLKCHCASGPDQGIIIQYTGVDCTSIAPPPPAVCQTNAAGVPYTDCTSCLGASVVQALSCEWCPNDVTNYSAYLTSGTCQKSLVCGTVRVTQCVPPQVFSIPTCPDNCLGNGDCENVTVPLTCFNKVKDVAETDVDCGGPDCYLCPPTKSCLLDSDCVTGLCQNSAAPPSSGNSIPAGATCGVGCTCAGSGFYNSSTSNVTQKCVCHAGFSGNNCGIAPAAGTTSSTIIGATLGAAAVVGIIIGALLCAAASGGGALAVYNKAAGGPDAAITSNPLYVNKDTGADNPLFRNT